MTLVLSISNPLYALQVSDRLVSTIPHLAAYDREANKTIVLRASDALVVIGYSGVAYVAGMPTDSWLAKQILGDRYQDRGISAGPGGLPDLGQIILRFIRGFESMPLSLRRVGLWISVVGFQIGRKARLRHLSWYLAPTSDKSAMTAEQSIPRHLPHRLIQAEDAVPRNGLPPGERRSMLTRLHEIRQDDYDAAERILIETIRQRAQARSGVGPHCMCALLAPGVFDHVRVRYEPLSTEPGSAAGQSFSPWIIGPRLISPPTEMNRMVGGPRIMSPGLNVVVEVPPSDLSGPGYNAVAPQCRRPAPGRRF